MGIPFCSLASLGAKISLREYRGFGDFLSLGLFGDHRKLRFRTERIEPSWSTKHRLERAKLRKIQRSCELRKIFECAIRPTNLIYTKN